MDKPADPATPFGEVYQAFLDDLALEGTKPATSIVSTATARPRTCVRFMARLAAWDS